MLYSHTYLTESTSPFSFNSRRSCTHNVVTQSTVMLPLSVTWLALAHQISVGYLVLNVLFVVSSKHIHQHTHNPLSLLGTETCGMYRHSRLIWWLESRQELSQYLVAYCLYGIRGIHKQLIHDHVLISC